MGMFDWVTCEYPLPDAGPHSTDGYQTKTFEKRRLWHYRITAEGRLLKRDNWSMKEQEGDVEPPETWNDQNYHGILNFYTFDDETGDWFEYDAKFRDGWLLGIERVDVECVK